jgi:hypothetical protein
MGQDGVHWNNNNAENAVKRFVARRKGLVGTGAYSEEGMKGYLTQLSLYQTFRYRKLSFWKFLSSDETDITSFSGNQRWLLTH